MSTTTDALFQTAKEVMIPTYSPAIALVRGQGARVWDSEGREYLDFLAGIPGDLLGAMVPEENLALGIGDVDAVGQGVEDDLRTERGDGLRHEDLPDEEAQPQVWVAA